MKLMKLLTLAFTVLSIPFCFAQEFDKENLGPNINTSYADTKPLISPDGKILFFARQFYPENINGEKDAQDIYYSQYLEQSWSKAVNIGTPLNDRYPNGVSSISPDGNTLLVLNAYDDGSVKNGVSIAHKDGNNWALPKMLNIRDYYNKSAFVDYYISNNEQEMLLTIEGEDAFGDQDIYVCFRMDETHWTEPVNLGAVINTQMAEFSPFLAADNKTLFFASEGHGSYGSSDIFYSKRLDDSWQKWSEPINLGSEINTDGFEGYYSIPASGEYAYFVSDNGGIEDSKDIFKAIIPYRFLPEPVLLMSGHVIDKITHDPLEAVILYEAVGNSKEMGEASSEKHDGSFKIILPHGFAYRYYAKVDGYFGMPLLVDEVKTNEYHEVTSNLYLIPLGEGNTIPIFDIFFDGKSDNLVPESTPELMRIVEMMNQNPLMKIEITAFTNDFEIGQKNLKLSEDRAWSIRHYLVNNKIATQRIEHRGLGARQFTDDYLKVNPSINTANRIEIKILSLNWSMPNDDSSAESTVENN